MSLNDLKTCENHREKPANHQSVFQPSGDATHHPSATSPFPPDSSACRSMRPHPGETDRQGHRSTGLQKDSERLEKSLPSFDLGKWSYFTNLKCWAS